MFKVTILEILEKDQKNVNYEKVAETGNEKDGKAQYDYVVSPIPKTVQVERKLFEQNCEFLDLLAVIKAVNGL